MYILYILPNVVSTLFLILGNIIWNIAKYNFNHSHQCADNQLTAFSDFNNYLNM